MSTPIRAGRPILTPGWDDLPIDRPHRRSSRWRRLLSGRAGITRFQPGACCGCSTFTNCASCNLLSAYPTIHITDSSTTVACTVLGTTWVGCYMLTGLAANSAIEGCGCQNRGNTDRACSLISYRVECDVGNPLNLIIDRAWTACNLVLGNANCAWCCPDGFTAGTYPCTPTYSPCAPGQSSPLCSGVASDSGSVTLSSCTPFPLSATLTLGSAGCFLGGTPTSLASPLGAGITINS